MSLATLTDLARLERMPSYLSIAQFIAAHADFPVLHRGRYGKPLVLDFDAASAFVREHWRNGRNERCRLVAMADAASTTPHCELDLFGEARAGVSRWPIALASSLGVCTTVRDLRRVEEMLTTAGNASTASVAETFEIILRDGDAVVALGLKTTAGRCSALTVDRFAARYHLLDRM